MTIARLDPVIVSRIAAGEVVERPASVVKELIENAVDAGATRITVEIKGGGVDTIRVTDNGSGIPSDEVELAFQRYATSKIHTLDDLYAIQTLGFRGEALASISAVADVDILTRTSREISGCTVSLRNGQVVERKSQARSPGTTITVRHLFRNVPARLKFLKSASTENGHILNVINQYALAYPEISFKLFIEGKQNLTTSGNGNLVEVIQEVYGKEIASGMLEINLEDTEWNNDPSFYVKVTGMVGAPSIARSSRNYLSFFVNRRWVSGRQLTWALEEAYHGLLMQDRYPVAVINITLPPDRLDVNIHPAKSEIKFADERAVFNAIQKAVRNTLNRGLPVPVISDLTHTYNVATPSDTTFWNFKSDNTSSTDIISRFPPKSNALPILRVVGQVAGNYIIAEGEDGIYIIDQHAAHERIRYEEIKKQKTKSGVISQGLLEPSLFECPPRYREILKNIIQECSVFGFNIEPFGDNTCLVRGVPAILYGKDWATSLQEILEALASKTGVSQEERIIKSLACHSAVRAGQVLSPDEMRELIRQLEQSDMPRTCPHGRPTVLHLSTRQLEKEFGRT